MGIINDQEYIDKVLAGDAQSFAILVDRYKELIYTLAIRMLKNKEEAEEVAQDTFMKVFNSLSKFKKEAKFSTWLYRITYNACLDRLKRKKVDHLNVTIDEFVENQLSNLETAIDGIEQKERSDLIQHCLQLLPSEDAFLLSLYYFEEQSVGEISNIVNWTASNVKVKLYRSRKKLASILRMKMEPEEIVNYEG